MINVRKTFKLIKMIKIKNIYIYIKKPSKKKKYNCIFLLLSPLGLSVDHKNCYIYYSNLSNLRFVGYVSHNPYS